MKNLILALAGILIAACALHASSVSMIGTLSRAGIDTVHMTVDAPAGQDVSFNFSGSISSIKAQEGSGNVVIPAFSISNQTSSVTLHMPTGHDEIDITTDDLTTKSGIIWRFNSTVAFSVALDNINCEVDMPSASEVISTNGVGGAKNGNPALLWHYEHVMAGQATSRYITYGVGAAPDYTQIYEAAAFVLGAAAAGLTGFLLSKRRAADSTEPKLQKQEREKTDTYVHATAGNRMNERDVIHNMPAFRTLEETDKEIVREIHAQGGKTTQAHLYVSTHIAKATLSRHLASLERRGLVKRTQKGIKKLISLAA